MKNVMALLATAVVLATASSALADEGDDYKTLEDPDGYGVIFRDDPLAGQGMGGDTAIVRGSFRPVRLLLIRPRTHFLPELAKSVESI